MEAIDNYLFVEAVLDWIGFPTVPGKTMESIQNFITSIDGIWITPPATEIMPVFFYMGQSAVTERETAEMLRGRRLDRKKICQGLSQNLMTPKKM